MSAVASAFARSHAPACGPCQARRGWGWAGLSVAAWRPTAELAGAAGLCVGLWTRLCALSLFSTMALAVYFHVAQSGLEGFPLGVVEKHQYAFEPAALYCLLYFYFLVNGGGAVSLDNALKKK